MAKERHISHKVRDFAKNGIHTLGDFANRGADRIRQSRRVSGGETLPVLASLATLAFPATAAARIESQTDQRPPAIARVVTPASAQEVSRPVQWAVADKSSSTRNFGSLRLEASASSGIPRKDQIDMSKSQSYWVTADGAIDARKVSGIERSAIKRMRKGRTITYIDGPDPQGNVWEANTGPGYIKSVEVFPGGTDATVFWRFNSGNTVDRVQIQGLHYVNGKGWETTYFDEADNPSFAGKKPDLFYRGGAYTTDSYTGAKGKPLSYAQYVKYIDGLNGDWKSDLG